MHLLQSATKISFAFGTLWEGKMTGFTIQAVTSQWDEEENDYITSWVDNDQQAQAFGIYATMEDNTSQWITDMESRASAEELILILNYIGQNFVQS